MTCETSGTIMAWAIVLPLLLLLWACMIGAIFQLWKKIRGA